MPEKKELIRSYNKLTKEDVLRIWTLRAGGMTNKEIAEDIGCAQYVSSEVVHRDKGPQVPIPAQIRQAAIKSLRKRKKKVFGPKPDAHESALAAAASATLALPDYINACIQMERSKEACLAAGVTADTLELLRIAAKEQVASQSQVKKKG